MISEFQQWVKEFNAKQGWNYGGFADMNFLTEEVSEVGIELAKLNTSCDSEQEEKALEEMGDVVNALCALANFFTIDLKEAFEEAIPHYVTYGVGSTYGEVTIRLGEVGREVRRNLIGRQGHIELEEEKEKKNRLSFAIGIFFVSFMEMCDGYSFFTLKQALRIHQDKMNNEYE